MNRFTHNRRTFLRKSAGMAAAGVLTPYIVTAADLCGDARSSKNDRPNIGCIGVGWMGSRDLHAASQVGRVVAVCDVDRTRVEAASDGGKRAMFDDYRKLLDRKDIDIVTISTPDHWHTQIALDALKAGKDIYCQKPLTLTIDEGKRLCKAIRQSDRVFQVGTQQRSNDDDPDATPIGGQQRPEKRVISHGRRHVPSGADRQDSSHHLCHRQRAQRWTVPEDNSAARVELGYVVRPTPEPRISRSAPTRSFAFGTNTRAAS